MNILQYQTHQCNQQLLRISHFYHLFLSLIFLIFFNPTVINALILGRFSRMNVYLIIQCKAGQISQCEKFSEKSPFFPSLKQPFTAVYSRFQQFVVAPYALSQMLQRYSVQSKRPFSTRTIFLHLSTIFFQSMEKHQQ